MARAVEHLVTHRSALIPLKPGGRKTSITLAAFCQLQVSGQVKTMLVIAPLRVCRQVWRQEAAKWSQFRHLKFALLHGAKKDEALRSGADVYLINPEGVAWLCKQYMGRQLPFDIVTVDELTKFKNHQSERSKALRPRIERVAWKWGLTGSLAPNGYLDIFGQILLLDGGVALGRYITHYRDSYFTVDYDGFSYNLMPGADKRITTKIAPYALAVDESDYAQLPPLVDNPILLDLDKAGRATYEKMKKDMLAELPEGIVTASNAAACYSKLSQMANGAVYVGDNKQAASHIHDLKLDAIEELLEELQGEPLLVGYEFNHDLDRLRERFGVVDKATGKKVIPYLGRGTTAAQEDQWIRDWNLGKLPLLCAHPASAGHGLNMQGASAANVAWFGITWDFELFDQFIRRIWRSGTQAVQVFNHLLIVRGTIDELKLEALRAKDMTQTGLLRALNRAISREAADAQGRGDFALDDRRLPTMVARLSTQNPVPQGHAAAQTEPVRPKGWGAPADDGPRQGAAEPDQRARIQQQIAPSPQDQARSAFSGAVTGAKEAIAQTDYGATGGDPVPQQATQEPQQAKPTRTRSRAQSLTQEQPVESAMDVEQEMLRVQRMEVLRIAFSDPATSLEDGLSIARDMMDFVTRG